MPAIDFPAAPAVNDEYSFEGRTWRWNGTGWEVKEYPAALLAGTAANPSLYFSGDPNTGLYSPGADQVAISTGGTERARIDSSGRLLVGTSSARSLYGQTGVIQTEGTAFATSGINLILNNASALGPLLMLGKSRGSTNGSNTIVQSGDILGEVYFCGADGNDLDTPGASIKAEVDGTPGANDMPGRLVFSTTADGASTPTERMRITSGGTIVIGSNPNVSLDVRNTNAASLSDYFVVGRYGGSTTTSLLIYTNGNVENTNNSYGAFSDVKLKENIVDASSQWDDLKALQVRKYNFKEGQTHTQIGLIAQEVELVSPGLVSESPDRDEEGNDLGTVTKSVNYSVLYMKAVKALQEAMERIEVLEASNTDLLARVSTLESKP